MQEMTLDLAELLKAPQYPQLGINIEENGATLVIVLGPATTITQGVPVEAMDDICKKWMERHSA